MKMSMAGKETLDLIVPEFPGMEKRITELYHECSNFLETCEDFVVCMDSIQQLKSKKNPGYEEELEPLCTALSDLKKELISKIE